MRIERLHRLTVERPAALSPSRGQTNCDRTGNARPPEDRPRVVQNLIQRDAREISELHLNNWPESFHCRPNRGPDHCVLANRSVQHPAWKFFSQTFCRFEGAAKGPADVLPINEDSLVVPQQFGLRFTNRFEISDAHSA